MERVLVVGTAGSGKTTFARRLARALGAQHIELDGLFWDAGWRESDTEVFRDRARLALDTPRWVACGNYWSKLRDLTWASADTVVWLDLPVWTCYLRVVTRTVKRVLLRERLWSDNRESIRSLWSEQSLLREIAPRKAICARRYTTATQDPQFAHVQLVRLTSPAAVRGWWRAHRRAIAAPRA